jgi:Tc toxin complex TcA C-terminal TcB-binding domain/Neuraminidase-like domain/Salmonella virulence plasmid 28.1kDa A protein
MKALIQLTQLNKKDAVVRSLRTILQNNQPLKQQILTNGIVFEKLTATDITTLKERLATANFSSYTDTKTSLQLLAPNGNLDTLQRVFLGLLHPDDEFARVLWSKGFIFETLTQDQANDLKQRLEAESAQVTLIADTPAEPKTFTLSGLVKNQATNVALPNIRVEARFRANHQPRLTRAATTNDNGAFLISFDDTLFANRPAGQSIDVNFQLSQNDRSLQTNTTIQNLQPSDRSIEILATVMEPTDNPFIVRGTISQADGSPLVGAIARAFDLDLRSEQLLGQAQTDSKGFYQILYSPHQFNKQEKGNADLVVKALKTDDSLLAASPIWFNAPAIAEVNLIIPANVQQPPSLFEKMSRALAPLLNDLSIAELEETPEHQDLTFLTGETGFNKDSLARFVIAHKLSQQAIQPEFWFVLLGGSVYEYTVKQSLEDQLVIVLDMLPSLDKATVGKALMRGFNQQEIAEALQQNIDTWIEAFLQFVAKQTVSQSLQPTFIQLALEDAGIQGAEKQEKFARLFNQYRTLTPELLETLEQDPSFTQPEIADLRTSFQLADLIQGNFSVVKMLKQEFSVRQPEQIRALAKRSESEWVNLIAAKQAAGDIELPIAVSAVAGQVTLPEAEVYGKMLDRQFREAFPTTAFSGGLGRALQNGGAHGLRYPEVLGRFLDRYETFEFLNTPVDDFFKNNTDPESLELTEDENFRLEVKAVQRVFKLVPTYEAADALLADDLHSAQKVYRLGKSKFVRRYSGRSGLTPETARLAWNRAADTHAAVLTIVADLKALEAESLPLALQNNNADLSTFPNWNNLFQTGDLCECAHCRSVLSPAAYFADLLMFLKDRPAKNPTNTVKDLLLARRPDLGFLELNCDNALVPLPYIDVVCEVLEDAIAAGENNLELTGFTAIPTDFVAAKADVVSAFAAQNISLGVDFSLSQVNPSDPNRWVVHGDDVTYLLIKKATPNFFAKILPNTKVSADELRAYPQYVNPQAYDKLRAARYPLALPFDLFAEEVRAGFQKTNLQRWDLMQVLRGNVAPNNPTNGEIAAEYFNISTDAAAAFDEKRLILLRDANVAEQQVIWGETGANWLDAVGNVKTFLLKTSLEYNELLALLDLKFINPAGDIAIQHLDASCDTDQKVILGLNVTKLDRIHRFLRLWRKLKGWKMWELDLAIRHPRIGNGSLDESFLINLFYFSQLKNKLKGKTTVEQVCALFGNLNTETRFTKLYEKREDALYQNLFLNKRLFQPLDPNFQLDPNTGDLLLGTTITAHQSVVLAALGIGETDLVLLQALAKASDGTLYITDDLTLANLSFLWRHSWLAKMLKFKLEDWKLVLKLGQQDLLQFPTPHAAWEFVERIDYLKATGFTPDDLNWLLAGDRTAKSATPETDTARFLLTLRQDLQAIQAEYDPAQYSFLTAIPPTDIEDLTTLLTGLLQKLNRDEAGTQFFIATLRDEVNLETTVAGLPASFVFPDAITSTIRISYDTVATKLRFTGLMTATQQTTLLTDASLAAVTGIAAYQTAINELFYRPRLELKFFELVFMAPLANLSAEIDFKALTDPALALKISYDAEQRLLRFAGILSNEDNLALNALSTDVAYLDAVASLTTQPGLIAPPSDRIWLLDNDLQFPLRDLTTPANDPLAINLATAVTKALTYLSKTFSQSAVIEQSSVQLGLTEALTRHLLTQYALLPDTLLVNLTGPFAATIGVVDYATLKTTFDGWFWANRVAAIVSKWKITLADLEKITVLTTGAQLLDFGTLPLDSAGAIAASGSFLRTNRLLRLRDSLPETEITLLEVLEKLNQEQLIPGTYATNLFADDVELMNEAWLATDVNTLTASLNLAYPAGYLLAENWERLRQVFYFIDKLNASASKVSAFAAAAMDDIHAKLLREFLCSKFGIETWLTLSAEIQDVLRERKRDALIAYLLTQPQPIDAPSGKWENTNDLYAYYLLDVEMSSCQLTSRLVQGSGSVQLFVQRCFMGLEPDVVVNADGDSAWLWWQWMRKYRVWEANRKVFLWPENWIEPELKPDRSPFFKDLENELLQNEIDQYTVETAFTNYLEKLHGVAQLEIAGFYQEDDGDNTIIHVFGRTSGAEPHLYYYRRYDYRQWTPWEKVDLDIQGDYLIPAVVNQRLFLFWPVFTEVPDEASNSTVDIPAMSSESQPGQPVPKTFKKLRLQMAVSDYRQGKWTPKRVSKDFDESGMYDVEIVRKHYRFFPIDRSEVDGRFGIRYEGHSLGRNGLSQADLYGTFEISGCQGIPELTFLPGYFKHAIQPEQIATGDDTAFLKWVELDTHDLLAYPNNDFTLKNAFLNNLGLNQSDGDRHTQLLVQTPGIFKMTPPWHLSYLDRLYLDGLVGLKLDNNDGFYVTLGTWLPFFYNDKKRTFFVLPSTENQLNEVGGSVRYYYPEIKKFFSLWENFFTGQVQTRLESFDLSTLSPLQREQVEQFLQQQFPEEASPPYTDEQVKELGQRWFMRGFHGFLGTRSLELFQFRQFHFKNNYHPFVCDFAKLVYNPLKGIPALMNRETQLQNTGFNFRQTYQPTDAVVKLPPQYPLLKNCYPKEDVDFTPDGAYSPYNWELFYHAPLLIANSLSKNQRFEEARDWYHFIFNPIGVETTTLGGSPMSKYWITKPFFETTDPQYIQQRIDRLLGMLAGDTTVPDYSTQTKKDLEDQVLDWRTNPFEPHRIANYRTVAYQKTVVMKYLDNLIAWGDNLFRQDSMESINEATQLYILAAEILGSRPQKIPPQAKPPLESFNELETQFDAFSNALVEVENLVPVMSGNGQNGADPAPLPMLYFCIPQNDKMLGYWDTVADRLYKIRHCMNIEGVVRQLALFEPPIDPGALVKAVAGGLDIGAAIAELNAPLPLYRFNVLLQKANEVCNDVKALGSALLSALEKKDAEAMGLLRQSQEIRLLEAVKAIREQQISEAKENLEGVKKSKELAESKKKYYDSREFMNAAENVAILLNTASTSLDVPVSIGYITGGVLKAIPNFLLGASGFGGSPHATAETGGSAFGDAAKFAAEGLAHIARNLDKMASLSSTMASYTRRKDDWDFQKDLAVKEIEQLDKLIESAKLRIAIAEKELENHVLQIENAKATDEFMRSKYTNQELYQWQVGQISGVYFQSYKLAYDLAKRAERCFRFELGLQDSSYIQFGYWDSLKKGLLSGEKLQYDLRRLETAYMDQNRREFELVKHISLMLLDPLALVKLRETGQCFINLPEETFDLDYPGHYFRRIKSVSLTLPCVTGSYTTISCTLRLLKNSIRINTANGDNGYPHNTDDTSLPTDDNRFIENNIPVKAIATSNAQNDSGVFELSFRDDRYLPFEGAGAISEWSLELFNDLPSNNPDPGNPDFGRPLRQFDYGTITDAIVHVKYTAREDAGVFKNSSIAHLRDYFSHDDTTPSLRMFNLRQEFPSQWQRFLNPANPAEGNVFELEMIPNLFPIRDAKKTLKFNTMWLLARCTDAGSYKIVMTPPLPEPPPNDSNTMTLTPVNQYGGLHFSQKDNLGIELVPTDALVKWQLKMTRPSGGNLQEDQVKKIMEVEDLLLVLGYEWKQS